MREKASIFLRAWGDMRMARGQVYGLETAGRRGRRPLRARCLRRLAQLGLDIGVDLGGLDVEGAGEFVVEQALGLAEVKNRVQDFSYFCPKFVESTK